jgi:hypothetical protein
MLMDLMLEIANHCDYRTINSIKLSCKSLNQNINETFWITRYEKYGINQIIKDDNIYFVDRLTNDDIDQVIKESSMRSLNSMLSRVDLDRSLVLEMIKKYDNGSVAKIFFDTGNYEDSSGDSRNIFTAIFDPDEFGHFVGEIIEDHPYYDLDYDPDINSSTNIFKQMMTFFRSLINRV